MRTIKMLLFVVGIGYSLSLFAQSKGLMPISSSSPDSGPLVRKAWEAFFDAKFEDGNGFIKQALDADPNCAVAMAFAGTVVDDASARLAKASAMNMSDDEKLMINGMIARLERKPSEDYFSALLKKYPKDNQLYVIAMFNTTDPKKAIEFGETITKASPKFAPAYNLLGYRYMEANEMAKAEASFDKYISLRPDLHNVYDSKGDFMMRAGKIAEAQKLFEKAASMGMKNSAVKADRAGLMLKYPKPTDADITQIKDMITASYQGYKTSDLDMVLKPFSPQAIQIFASQMCDIGLANIRARMSGAINDGFRSVRNVSIESINGTGDVAIARGKVDGVWTTPTVKEQQRNYNAIFVLHRQSDGWKIVAEHYFEGGGESITDEDRRNINGVFSKWTSGAKVGNVFSEADAAEFVNIYSGQAIEMFGNQRANVGNANIRTRITGFAGGKFESNNIGNLGFEVTGKRAAAWGIAKATYYQKDATELTTYTFPWTMILTKENDNAWKILFFHWQ